MASISDDFNRADSTNLGANWVEVSGDWSIVSNQLSPGSAGGTIILRAAGAMDTSDHYAQITITATTAASHGIWIRGNSNITQGYLVRNNGTSWDLFYVVGGSFTSIGTYAAAAVAGDVVKLQAVGSAIKVYINGTLRISVTDTVVPTGTSVGVRSESTSAIRFDDFSASDITAGATLTIAAAVETAQPLTGTKSATLTTATAIETAQPLTGAKTATLGLAATSEMAQPLPGSKAAPLTTAAATETAQPLTAAKTTALPVAAATETAQALAGTKTAPLTTGGAVETAQPLTGGKTAPLATALETATAQAVTGTKTAPLPAAAAVETAQPLTGAPVVGISPALAVETAQLLTGTKTAVLTTAIEISTARPLSPPGSTGQVTLTAGPLPTPWTANTAPRRWTAFETPGPWTVKEATP